MKRILVLAAVLAAAVVVARPPQTVATVVGDFIQEGSWTFLRGVNFSPIVSTRLAPCTSSNVGLQVYSTASNKAGKACLCTNDSADAGLGAYTYQNLATGTFGTTSTTCGTE